MSMSLGGTKAASASAAPASAAAAAAAAAAAPVETATLTIQQRIKKRLKTIEGCLHPIAINYECIQNMGPGAIVVEYDTMADMESDVQEIDLWKTWYRFDDLKRNTVYKPLTAKIDPETRGQRLAAWERQALAAGGPTKIEPFRDIRSGVWVAVCVKNTGNGMAGLDAMWRPRNKEERCSKAWEQVWFFWTCALPSCGVATEEFPKNVCTVCRCHYYCSREHLDQDRVRHTMQDCDVKLPAAAKSSAASGPKTFSSGMEFKAPTMTKEELAAEAEAKAVADKLRKIVPLQSAMERRSRQFDMTFKRDDPKMLARWLEICPSGKFPESKISSLIKKYPMQKPPSEPEAKAKKPAVRGKGKAQPKKGSGSSSKQETKGGETKDVGKDEGDSMEMPPPDPDIEEDIIGDGDPFALGNHFLPQLRDALYGKDGVGYDEDGDADMSGKAGGKSGGKPVATGRKAYQDRKRADKKRQKRAEQKEQLKAKFAGFSASAGPPGQGSGASGSGPSGLAVSTGSSDSDAGAGAGALPPAAPAMPMDESRDGEEDGGGGRLDDDDVDVVGEDEVAEAAAAVDIAAVAQAWKRMQRA